jgi:hypothetical protein
MGSSRYCRAGVLMLLSWTATVARGETRPVTAERSITIALHASVDTALAAFGPTQESQWAPTWAPRFLATTGPSDDPDFAIFETGAVETPITWALTQHDRQHHHLQYVSVQPLALVTVIDVVCVPAGPDETRATITYRRTALRPAFDGAVDDFAAHFASQADHWQAAMNHYLEHR